MKTLIPTPATIVLIGSALAVFGSLIAAFGVYLGSAQDAKESKHLLASLTGGDSYPLIIVTQHDGSFFICVKGEYPLHDVNGNILDVAALREAQAKNADPLSPIDGTQYFEIGTLSPAYGLYLIDKRTNYPVLLKNFTARKSYRFMVHLYTRHHTFDFRLALEPYTNSKNTWNQAWQVFRDQDQKPMAQSIPEDFPKDIEGNVDFLLLPKSKMGSELTEKRRSERNPPQ